MEKTARNKNYWFENYKPSKTSVPVTYNGIEYLSKKQCCALEHISMNQLNKYLENNGK
jgi:hypothetical protein